MTKRQLSILSIPAEILCEFIQHDLSRSSLTRWCLVSRSILEFAGPLLYRDVALTREEDVVPYLIRLCFPTHHRAKPRLVPGVRRLKRLSVSAFPPDEDLFRLLRRRARLDPVESLSLTLVWDPAWENGAAHAEVLRTLMEHTRAPSLLLLLCPAVYTEQRESDRTGIVPRPVFDPYLAFLRDDVANLISRPDQHEQRQYQELMYSSTYEAISRVARSVRLLAKCVERYRRLAVDIETKKRAYLKGSTLFVEAFEKGARITAQAEMLRPISCPPGSKGTDVVNELISYLERYDLLVRELEQVMDVIHKERERMVKEESVNFHQKITAAIAEESLDDPGAKKRKSDFVRWAVGELERIGEM